MELREPVSPGLGRRLCCRYAGLEIAGVVGYRARRDGSVFSGAARSRAELSVQRLHAYARTQMRGVGCGERRACASGTLRFVFAVEGGTGIVLIYN